jgi:pimeloyl-ACP methyl ester carboxylesterase
LDIAVADIGDGEPVVLMHAGVADSRMWRHIVPALAAEFRVITFDFRGFGATPPATRPYRCVDDLAAVLDSLGLSRVHLVGASMGGRIAMEFALASPQRVGSLALLAPGLGGWDYSPAMLAYFADEEAALARHDLDTVVELNCDVWVRGPRREWTDRLRAVAQQVREPLRIIAANQADAEDLEFEADPSARDGLAAIAAPTLVLIADADPEDLIAVDEHIAVTVPGARAVHMADTGHLIALERPRETLAELLPFLRSYAL